MKKIVGDEVEARLEKILGETRLKVEELAAEYRRDVIVPLCKRLRLSYYSGMGNTAFYDHDDNTFSQLSDVEDDDARRDLKPAFEALNQHVFDNEVFGYFVDDFDVEQGQEDKRVVFRESLKTEEWEAHAPDGSRFDGELHMMVEPYGRGTTKREALKALRGRVSEAKLTACPAGCDCRDDEARS